MHFLIDIVTILVLINITYIIAITICDMKSTEKCLGDIKNTFDYGIPNDNAKFIKTYFDCGYSTCADLCDRSIQCRMAAIDTSTRTCSLYENISFQGTALTTRQLYTWFCCNTTSSYPAPYRCPGFWKLIAKYQSDNFHRTHDPLAEFQNVNDLQCRQKCLDNRICGAVNVLVNHVTASNEVTCQLIIQYPVEKLQLNNDSNWITFQWQCATNYSLPTPNKTCMERTRYSQGYWIIQNESQIFTNLLKQVLVFQTLDYNQCLLNCALYPDCKAAWYSLNSLYCILEAYSRTTCAEPLPPSNCTFTVYVWKVCNQQQFQQSYIEDMKIESCRKLLSNKYVYIFPMECGSLSKMISQPYPCWIDDNHIYGTTFRYSFHCQTGQSFSILNIENRYFPSLHNSTKVTWYKVSSGYDIFYLINASDENFPLTGHHNFKIFDANNNLNGFKPLKIIKRNQWFAPKPYKPPQKLKYPVTFAIITDTERPFCNCFSIEACSYVLRELHISMKPIFGSIHHSFIVTGDGTVYEGRGWDYAPTISPSQPFHESISFALCGRYNHNPNLKSIFAIKQLIITSIKLKKLSSNYTLYLYNDIINQPYPFDGLRKVIELWPHYRGYTKREHCLKITDIIIYMNIVTIICFIVSSIVTVHLFIKKLYHNKDCFSIRKCRIKSIYGDFSTATAKSFPQLPLSSLNELSQYDQYLSPLTTDFYWIEPYLEIMNVKQRNIICKCRDEIFSYLDLCRFQSQLVNMTDFLHLPMISSCSKKSVYVMNINEDSNNLCLFIHHYNDERTFYKFILNLQRSLCVCDSFHLIKYINTSSYFGTDIRNYRVIKSDTKASDYVLRDRYTYLIEGNTISRFYS